MGGRRVLAVSTWISVAFFLLTILSSLVFSRWAVPQLARLESPLVNAFKAQPFHALLFSRAVAAKALGIFLTNFRFLLIGFAGVLAFRLRALGVLGRILGFIAVLYYVFTLFLNGVAAGLVVAEAGATRHISWILVWLLGILPHGIFEIWAYALSAALLLAAMNRGALRVSPVRWAVLATVVLLVAAFIEAGVTPHLLGLVLTQ